MPYRRFVSPALFSSLAALTITAAGVLISAHAASPNPAACAEKRGCEAKFCRIQTEIDYAREHGNTRKEAGLKQALEEARASCTDERLAADRTEKIKDRQEDVKEREAELAEAREDGRPRKIERAERKLKEAQEKLTQAQNERD